VTLLAGVTILVMEMIVVATLSARRNGARLGVLVAGLLLPVAAFVSATPIQRGLLTFAFVVCFVQAVQLSLNPFPGGFGARLASVFLFIAFIETRAASKVQRRFDARSAVKILLATAIATISVVIWCSTSSLPLWLRFAVRLPAGAVLIFAAVEITDAFMRLLTGLAGVTLPPLHDAPYRSRSLSEFWGRRWNIGAATALRALFFAPLAHRSPALALFTTFAASAVLHAYIAAVALGVRPALMWAAFFLVQPLMIVIERQWRVQHWPRSLGRTWTALTLALTSPLLVVPFLNFFKITL